MKSQRPPRLAEWLFDWYCGNAKVDDLRGDMEEVFERNVQKIGSTKARWIYWRQTLSLVFSYAIRKRKKNSSYHHYSSANAFTMLGNYFKVAFRNLLRYKYFTIINMLGVAIGMSVSLLIITLFISITDYDEFQVNKKNIYRIVTRTSNEEDVAAAPAPLVEKLRSEFPGIKEVVQISGTLSADEPQPKQNLPFFGYYVDPSFLSTFTFPLVVGNPKTVLNDPHALVLTEKTAKKIFGDLDPMGRDVQLSSGLYQVRGIMKDFPPNTHLSFQALAPISTVADRNANMSVEDAWSKFRSNWIYLHVDDNFNVAELQNYLDKVSSEVYKKDAPFSATFHVQAMTDITPGPDLENAPGASWSYVSFVIAGALALLILLPACFNYTNISIARALKRSKEIGLRKALGSRRRQIFTQFISETVIVTTLSLVGACAIFVMIRSEFKATLVHAAALDLSLTPGRFLWFLLFALITGLIAGVLPAAHFSNLNPIDAIKNNFSAKVFSGIKMRKALIVFQFTLCLTFILGMIIFNKQYRYALNYDLGFKRENILDIDLYAVNPNTFKTEFSKIPSVQQISMSSSTMGHGVGSSWATLQGKTDSVEVYEMYVDGSFIPNMDVKLLAGKTFSEGKHDESSVVINEVLLKRFNFAGPSEALGQVIQIDTATVTIIGVVKSFHFWQLHAPPASFFFRNNPEKFRLANLKIVSSDMDATLRELEQTWKKVSPEQPMTSKFLDDATVGAFYQFQVLLKIFGFLGFLAISVSCLGLLGMIVYTAEIKTKEVGIRKVMGASRMNLAILLSKDFLKLMLIASMFAIPLTFMFNWLLSGLVYYRVAISVFDVLGGLIILFALGIGTMASQTWKTASINPAETLKYE